MKIADKIKERKRRLESDLDSVIMEKLREFEKDTGANVSGIDFGLIKLDSLESKASVIVPTGVEVTLDI